MEKLFFSVMLFGGLVTFVGMVLINPLIVLVGSVIVVITVIGATP